MGDLYVSVAVSLRSHPKVRPLARALGIPRYAARGLLVGLWSLATEHAHDGHLTHWSPADLAEDLEWDGDPDLLVRALIESGWLDGDITRGLSIHDWHDHTGRGLSLRSKWREKKRLARGTNPGDKAGTVSGDSLTTQKGHVSHDIDCDGDGDCDRDGDGDGDLSAPGDTPRPPPPVSREDDSRKTREARARFDALTEAMWSTYKAHSGGGSQLGDEPPEAARQALVRATTMRPTLDAEELTAAVRGLCASDWWMGRAARADAYQGRPPTRLKALTRLLEDAGRPIEWGVWVDTGRQAIAQPKRRSEATAVLAVAPEPADEEASAAIKAMRRIR